MKVTVVGAGQMGSIYAAAAAENGNEVWLVDANQAVVDAISERGLLIDRRDGNTDTYRLPATSDPTSIGQTMDLVLFQTKGWATSAAAESVRPIVDGRSVLLTLQNGLGNEEAIRIVFPDNELLIGVSVHTVVTVDVAHYGHTGVRNTVFGPSRGDDLGPARRAASAFEAPGFPVEVYPEDDIRREQWSKFVLNCGSLPTAALTRLRTDVLKDQPVVFEHMDNLTRETCAIAAAAGIALDPEERVGFQHELFRTAGGRASMLGDVVARRRTEIDTINGAAVMYAERYGVPAPLNRAMVALVKGLEKAIELGEA